AGATPPPPPEGDEVTRTPCRHLTPREIDRLLHNARLAERTRDRIWFELEMESDYMWELYSEQMAQYGRATRHRTPFDLYCAANPVHGPQFLPPCPGGCGMRADLTCECELPFYLP